MVRRAHHDNLFQNGTFPESKRLITTIYSLFLKQTWCFEKTIAAIPVHRHCKSCVLSNKNTGSRKTDYRITVTLNDTDNSLTGNEEIDYYNNSPDTLHFIWFHLWPNAYKNDRTAFSDQLLENGRTDFYFSEENKKGYINRLSFKVDDKNAVTEDHPQHQDIVKLILPQPLPPGGNIKIETPFHVKLPFNFSRGGHVGQSYQVTQWYPKPAVYDRKGWHEMPYLDQGEFYSEFGSFDVKITLPENYVVAATGDLQTLSERQWLKEKSQAVANDLTKLLKKAGSKKQSTPVNILSSPGVKTLRYTQKDVHDFAWFADKSFLVKADTLQLESGRAIDIIAFVLPAHNALWKNSLLYIKRAIKSKTDWVGEYPYNVVSVVDDASPVGGGMEYPTITLLTSDGSEAGLESVINHEVGHNWFYGILGTNERTYPWMDEGINTFYDKRYDAERAVNKDIGEYSKNKITANRIPKNPEDNLLATTEKIKKDQPISTSSEKFTSLNYDLVAYEKTGLWLQQLEKEIGRETFDKLMQAYYDRWKFKHPYPEDFRALAEEISGRDLSAFFKKADTKGSIYPPKKKQLKLASFFNLKDADKYNYISLAPAVGYNMYDKFMIGAIIHNYNVPPNNFQFIAVPLYAAGSKKINGIGRAEYNFFPGSKGARATVSGSFAKFTGDEFTDAGKKNPLEYMKIVPSLKYVFANKEPRSRMKKYIQWKTYLITESVLAYSTDPVSGNTFFSYPKENRYLNQLQVGVENNRTLYPYEGVITAQQGKGFVRLDFTGNYYFNYAKDGGLNLRFFAGKFIYTGDKGFTGQYLTDRYHLNLTGPKGYEDYTYSDYFIGRNEFDGGASQQIMKRDGFFKVKTDLLSDKIGKTDDWLCAINLTTDIPKMINPLSVLPVHIPLRIFLDAGTYAEAWKNNNTNTGGQPGKLLYDAGFQISLLHNAFNIYFPVIYSNVYRDYFKSTITEKRFVKNISFSFDFQQLKLSKLAPQISF